MSESVPFEYESQAAGCEIAGLYSLIEQTDERGARDFLDVQKLAGKMVKAARNEEREIRVMARGGTESHNLFVWDPLGESYELVDDNMMAYGCLIAVRCEFGADPQTGHHLFAYFESADGHGRREEYVLDMAHEGRVVPCDNRLYQVAEPSLEAEYGGDIADMLSLARWRSFAAMTWEWFQEGRGRLEGEAWVRHVEEEVVKRGFDLDAYITGTNLLFNPGAKNRLSIEATLSGVAYQLNPRETATCGLTPLYTPISTYPVVAVDFVYSERLFGYVFRHNRSTGNLERVPLDDNEVTVRVQEASE